MARFYVTMTWENWPDCGSYGMVVEAKNHAEAEKAVRAEMVTHEDGDEGYADSYYLVDCFDLDKFIALNAKEAG